jgi:hypothetical protein
MTNPTCGGSDMSKCPNCGRENVALHEGYEAVCGRRVTWNDSPGVLYPAESQWRERMIMAARCKVAGGIYEQA